MTLKFLYVRGKNKEGLYEFSDIGEKKIIFELDKDRSLKNVCDECDIDFID